MKDKIKPITVKYQYEKDEKTLEKVFTYVFDEIEKIINLDLIDEQQISDNKATV